jgi:septal ring factor EnvC (AmiA/AmiB activator)
MWLSPGEQGEERIGKLQQQLKDVEAQNEESQQKIQTLNRQFEQLEGEKEEGEQFTKLHSYSL